MSAQVSLTTDSANLCSLLQEYHRIFLAHPCLSIGPSAYLSHISSPFSFSLFSVSFPLSPFTVFPLRLVFRLVVFRLFPGWPSALFFSLPSSSWWLILCYRLGATPLPRRLRACKSASSPCVLSFLLVFYYLFFFSSFPFSISIWTSFRFILSFSCGYYYAVSSASVTTRSAYDMYLILTYAGLPCLFQLLCIIFSTNFVFFLLAYYTTPELLEAVL